MSSGPYVSTVWTRASLPPTGGRTSRTELTHATIAFVVLTVDLIIILSGRGFLEGGTVSSLVSPVPLYFVLIALAAAFTGFLAHELAHKWEARRLGCWAEFRMWPTGLLLSLLTSAAGFLFAAPGATMVLGMDPRDRRGWGRIGLAGPLMNLAFGLVFYLGSLATFHLAVVVSGALLFLALINTLFATFNLLPIGPLDGAKVLRWGLRPWITSFFLALVSLVVCYTAFYYYASPFLGR